MHRNTSIKNNKQTNNNATCSNDSSMPATATTINRIIRLFHSLSLSYSPQTMPLRYTSWKLLVRLLFAYRNQNDESLNHITFSINFSIYLYEILWWISCYPSTFADDVFWEDVFRLHGVCVLLFCFYCILCKSVLYQEVDPFVIYILLFRLYHCQYFRLVSACFITCAIPQCKYWPNELRQINTCYKTNRKPLTMNLIGTQR